MRRPMCHPMRHPMRHLVSMMRFLAVDIMPAVPFVLAMILSAAATAADVRDPLAPTPLVTVAGSFTVLCYHEARDDVRDYPDPFAVDAAALAAQFAWLRGNGYTPVSLDQIIAARQGGRPLPAKAVLLSFDDAYLSFYTRVYPLLREFRFPAVLGVVGKWIDNPRDESVQYGEKGTVSSASFPTWSQLREMAASGLVEIASHSYDLHRGVTANPQGNLQPAATARIYEAATGAYEGDASWRARVRTDLARSASVIERETGRRPRAMVWPYGSYNNELVRMAGELGMTITLTLNDGANTPDVPLTAVRRTLIAHNPALAEFAAQVSGPRYPEPLRVVQVNLDDVYSSDALQQERSLSVLLDGIKNLQPTHVYLQASTDLDGDGIADAAYFPTPHLPLRADLFNRVAWQLASRADVKVFAVLPVTGLRLPRHTVADLYQDLARHANFDGLVFADRLPPSVSSAVPGTADLIEFTSQLASGVRAFRAPLTTVRTLYAAQASGATAPAQVTAGFSSAVAAYDAVALIPLAANPDGAAPESWIADLASRVTGWPADAGARRKVVFLLPLDSRQPASGQTLARQMRALQLGGALNFGYASGSFANDQAALAGIARAMSLREYPLAGEKK